MYAFSLMLHFLKQNQLRFSEKGTPALSWHFKQNRKLTKVLNQIKINLLIIKGHYILLLTKRRKDGIIMY